MYHKIFVRESSSFVTANVLLERKPMAYTKRSGGVTSNKYLTVEMTLVRMLA